MKNSNLHAAKAAKNNEFYTQLTDIEKELKYYKSQFAGKVVYCNCDDARESNFFKYFSMNFEYLGLKKLICTGYKENGRGVVLVYEGDKNGNKKVDDEEIVVTELEGNGDFQSEECVNFLKECDIVVTNPPFSCYRIYIKQLMDYDKKFLVIGNFNAVTYKEIFPYIKDGKLHTGKNWVKEFNMPDGGKKKFGNICWFTNLETHKADDPTPIYKKYVGNEKDYPQYDNYNAIDCSKIADFPIDLPIGAVVGVPITIVDKIADDGFIYFDDGGVSGEKIGYGIEKFRKGDDGQDLIFTREREREREFSHTSESLSGVSSDRNEYNERSECQLLDNDKWQTKVRQNLYQAYKVIGGYNYSKDIYGKTWNARINGEYVFKRILIQKIK